MPPLPLSGSLRGSRAALLKFWLHLIIYKRVELS
nr:MAG TPA: hypothetical protein [Caudoviricetes sp.]